MARSSYLIFALFLSTLLLTRVVADGGENDDDPNYDNDDAHPCPLKGICTKSTCTTPPKGGKWRTGKWRMPGLKLGERHSSGIVLVYQILTRSSCCQKCANSTGVSLTNVAGSANVNCAYWVHLPFSGATCTGGTDDNKCGRCYIFPSGTAPTCDASMPGTNRSTIGKACPWTKDDPHFLGAHGARFEFNGEPDKSFCLLTQERIHLNMRMSGYYDSRTVGASIMKNGKALRTWIREIGLTWRDESNVEHTFTMAARVGKEQQRKEGFLASAIADGVTLPRLAPGQKQTLAGGMILTFVGYDKAGAFDVDAYTVKIPGLLDLDVKLRIAHPQLQSPDDAQTHINLGFDYVKDSANIHGIMGQTFRAGREQKALDYNALSAILHRPIAADGESGKGFLDGNVADYSTSGVLSTDCRYSVFNGESLPGLV